ncbi:MAG: Uma2 family endonuclease [Thermodesulfobacteriota bacterium]
MSLAHRHLPSYTVDDYQQWEGRWELVGGIPYAMSPSPDYTHQRVGVRISWQLEERLKDCPPCVALHETDWHVARDTIVRPDNMVVCQPPTDERVERTPAVIFEIVSKGSADKDESLKYELYEQEGVPYYVLLYPDRRLAKIYRLTQGRFGRMADASEETVDFALPSCTLAFDFSLVWP